MRLTLIDDQDAHVGATLKACDEIPQTCGVASEWWSSVAPCDQHDAASSFAPQATQPAIKIPQLKVWC
jgi:hypothetical protein